jgi:uncharacterized membrane protein (DUF485 family)
MKYCPKCGTAQNTQTLVEVEEEPNQDATIHTFGEEKINFLQEKNEYIFNYQQRNANITLLIALGGFLAMALPFIDEDKFGDFVGPMVFLGLFVGVSGMIVFFMFRKNAKLLDEIKNGYQILVHWKYDKNTWQKFNEDAYKDEKENSKALFIVMSVIMFIVAVVLLIVADFDEGSVKTAIGMLIVWAIIGIVGFSVAKSSFDKLKSRAGELIINPNALWLSGQFHSWKSYGSRLEELSYDEQDKMLYLTYSVKVRHGRQSQSFKFPVPNGKESEAIRLVVFFQQYYPSE